MSYLGSGFLSTTMRVTAVCPNCCAELGTDVFVDDYGMADLVIGCEECKFDFNFLEEVSQWAE
jgi:hypothetical protein